MRDFAYVVILSLLPFARWSVKLGYSRLSRIRMALLEMMLLDFFSQARWLACAAESSLQKKHIITASTRTELRPDRRTSPSTNMWFDDLNTSLPTQQLQSRWMRSLRVDIESQASALLQFGIYLNFQSHCIHFLHIPKHTAPGGKQWFCTM